MSPAEQKPFIQRMGRILVQAMTEILGEADTRRILDQTVSLEQSWLQDERRIDSTFPDELTSCVQTLLEDAFGYLAGRGLALQMGRSILKYSLREFGAELGFTGSGFRLLPLKKKIKTGSDILAMFINQHSGFLVDVATSTESICWQIKNCPFCRGRESDDPCCSMAIGFLQEGMYWVSGGKTYQMREDKCIANKGSVCSIVINTTPLN